MRYKIMMKMDVIISTHFLECTFFYFFAENNESGQKSGFEF